MGGGGNALFRFPLRPGDASKGGMTQGTMQGASHKRILGAAMAGTSVEFCDFYIFATAASLLLGPLFFHTPTP